jgi:hypothetical protein
MQVQGEGGLCADDASRGDSQRFFLCGVVVLFPPARSFLVPNPEFWFGTHPSGPSKARAIRLTSICPHRPFFCCECVLSVVTPGPTKAPNG